MTNGKPTVRCWICWLVGAIALAIIAYGAPAGAAPETESAAGLLDDLGGGLFAPKESPQPSNGSEQDQVQPGLAPPAGEDLGQAANRSPLHAIADRMQLAQRLIALQNLLGETAVAQEQVLADLDQLIKQNEQQNQSDQNQSPQQEQQQTSQRKTPQPSQASQSASGKAPGATNPARTSSERLQSSGVDQTGSLGQQELLKDVWGQLPERVRQQLLQSSTDEFLPEYRDEIERYFRRLAEEDSGEPARADQ